MDLFTKHLANHIAPAVTVFNEDAYLLQGGALLLAEQLIASIAEVSAVSPLRHMSTKMGFNLSAKMTNCGALGWVSDRKGYRYSAIDPLTGNAWPAMPAIFLTLATQAAHSVGFTDFLPDACLINQYQIGARMGLHQDTDEQDFSQPIVSVSLGLPGVFLFGGQTRADTPIKIPLNHGDIVVWGGKSRHHFHGVMPIKKPNGSLNIDHHLHTFRYNLTFRKAR